MAKVFKEKKYVDLNVNVNFQVDPLKYGIDPEDFDDDDLINVVRDQVEGELMAAINGSVYTITECDPGIEVKDSYDEDYVYEKREFVDIPNDRVDDFIDGEDTNPTQQEIRCTCGCQDTSPVAEITLGAQEGLVWDNNTKRFVRV